MRYIMLTEVQFRCLRCKTIVFQRDDDPSRVHERPECGGELEAMPFDGQLWATGRAKLMGGQAQRCGKCSTWFVSRGESLCWACG